MAPIFALLCASYFFAAAILVVTADANTCEWSSSSSKGQHWKPRERHHDASNALIGKSGSVWTYKSGRSDDDPRRYQVRYKLNTTGTGGVDFKYEFSCETLPKLSISADGGTFAIGCTQQNVPLYSGEILRSKQGQVTVFRWNADKKKCQVMGNLYGTETEEQFGTGIALNGHGDIVAVSGKEPSHLYVFRYHFDTKKWKQRGQTLENNNHRVVISNDGMILPVIKLQSKVVKIHHYNITGNCWEDEPLFGQAAVVGRSSSLALSGNGQVLAVQRTDKRFGTGVAILHRVETGSGGIAWELDPFHGFIAANGRHSTFGMITSLNFDGTRIAIGEPGPADGYGRVYVYDLDYDRSARVFGWVSLGDPLVGLYNKDAFGRQLWLSQDGRTLVVRSVSYSTIYEYNPIECLSDGSTMD